MTVFTEGLVVVLLFLSRLGIPILITLVAGLFLHTIDLKWAKEAHQQAAKRLASSDPRDKQALIRPPCWVVKDCAEEMLHNCAAHQNPSMPCWLAKLRVEGRIPRPCANCQMFRSAFSSTTTPSSTQAT